MKDPLNTYGRHLHDIPHMTKPLADCLCHLWETYGGNPPSNSDHYEQYRQTYLYYLYLYKSNPWEGKKWGH